MMTEEQLRARREQLINARDAYLMQANIALAVMNARISEIDAIVAPAPVTQEARDALPICD